MVNNNYLSSTHPHIRTLAHYNIAFDAKRAYHNTTGLGHYSRTLIQSLATYYPQHDYYLFNPKPSNKFHFHTSSNMHEVLPSSVFYRYFSSLWRSSGMKKDLKKLNIALYHGLSHEIPMGIQHMPIKSIVTIHDLIFERYPEQFGPIDARIHHTKAKNACTHADKIIAVSKQTKEDIIDFYNISPDKIEVCYQSCNPLFAKTVSEMDIITLKQYYHLPQQYFLYVGSIIERKNLLNVCKTIQQLGDKMPMPLVVVGEGSVYKKKVQAFVEKNKLENQIIFLSENPVAKQDMAFRTAQNFPALYQGATAVIYPSIFEGFGIPVLEALWSKVPVITSNISCLPETGGDAAYYIDPYNVEDIAHALLTVASDATLRANMIEKGWQHAQKFTVENCAAAVMDVYRNIML